MASPTAIPRAENSSHHHHHHHHDAHAPPLSPPRATTGLGVGGFSTTSNRNSPPLLSPIYTRTAFSLPGGPVSPSNSFRNTASGAWTTAGVSAGSAAAGPVKSPAAISSSQVAQKDYFPQREHFTTQHHRSSSTSSTTSSADSNGPTTPRSGEPPTTSLAGGAPLDRVRSIPLASSYDAIKSQKEGWNGSQGWAGLSSFRTQGNAAANGANGVNSASSPPPAGGGGMGNLFRRLSLSGNAAPQAPHRRESNGHAQRSASLSVGHTPAQEAPVAAIKERTEVAGVGSGAAPVAPAAAVAETPALGQQKARGRRADAAGSIKRKPSPHGERLLMGWTHAH